MELDIAIPIWIGSLIFSYAIGRFHEGRKWAEWMRRKE